MGCQNKSTIGTLPNPLSAGEGQACETITDMGDIFIVGAGVGDKSRSIVRLGGAGGSGRVRG